ncbi:MAG: biotin/lipoyl-binding protein [Clostridia bacterium]|nr:biotin/lipoyl-binding protein [Clostridia bacterium]
MKRSVFKIVTFIILIIFAVGLTGCTSRTAPSFSSPADKPGSIDEDSLYEVKAGTISSNVSGVGVFVPARETSLYFRGVSGVLKTLNIKLYDKVKAGQIIAETYSEDLEFRIKQLQSNISKTKERIFQIRNDIKNAEEAVELALMELNTAMEEKNKSINEEMEFAFDEASYNEIVMNLNKPIPADLKPNQIEDAKNQKEILKQRKARLEKIRERTRKNILKQREDQYKKAVINYNSAKRRLENTTKNSELTDMDLDTLKKELEYQQKLKSNCTLKANRPGTITFLDKVALNDFVGENWKFARLVDPGDLVMKFNSGDLEGYESGLKLKVKINGKEFRGAVYEPSPGDLIKPEEPGVKVKSMVYFLVENLPDDILINEPYEVSISTEEKKNAIVIPKSALRSNGAKYWVERYKYGGTEVVEVKKGIESGKNVEVLSGIGIGDKIVESY